MKTKLFVSLFSFGALLLVASVTKAQSSNGEGCSLSAAEVSNIQQQGLIPVQAVMSADRIAALVATLRGIRSSMKVAAMFAVYNDDGSPNAFATPEVLDANYPDGSVLFGRNLLFSELMSTGSMTNYTFGAILAHEHAHILQFKKHESLPTTKQKELEADYMAGWTMGQPGAVSPSWQKQAAMQALRSFYSHGDYAFSSPTHHGTPDERVRAVEAGLNDAGSTLDDAFSHAHIYVGGTNVDGSTGADQSPISRADAGGNDFCSTLKSLVSIARTNFRSIRGQVHPDTHGDILDSTKSLPGSSDCEIVHNSFTCDFEESASETDYEALVSKVRGCLHWQATRKSSSETDFAGPNDIEVDVEIDESSTLTIWINNNSDE